MKIRIPDIKQIEKGYAFKFRSFQDLMQFRVKDILLVSSLYNLYLFEEDGRLYELIRNEYQDLQLSQAPEITRVSSGKDAIDLLKSKRKFDLVIITLHTEDMSPINFAKELKKSKIDIPLVLLAFDSRELHELLIKHDTTIFDKIFIWNGDYKLIIGIIKYLEDKFNIENDTKSIGVQSIILIEDNIKIYSAFLPLIYMQLIHQSRSLLSEGINLTHKYMRMRARPKILLCSTYEEAMNYFNKYKDHILGIISDIDFPNNGIEDKEAGIKFAKEVRKRYSDIPILLQSSDPKNRLKAKKIDISFVLKDSPTLLHDVINFMNENFGFSDFIFKNSKGQEIGRANDLITLEENLKVIPEESIKYHGERNHFSNWLKARTEFWLADKLRPQKVSEFYSIEDLRKYLVKSLQEYRRIRQKGVITDFNKDTFDPAFSFARIGGGSLGGKARGLSFLNFLVNNYGISDMFEGVRIDVPPGIVLGTDVFEKFIDENNLRNFALESKNDSEIKSKFLNAEHFPEETIKSLYDFLTLMNDPLSVRSSSLLEDSLYHPFAGVYETYMIPNNEKTIEKRLTDLIDTIKLVFASTYYTTSKDYFKMTSYRPEEEKMAVIVQKMIGGLHKNRFYPDFSGVAKTFNYYPIPPQETNDGIVSVALGLGKMVVEGGNTVRFCPKYPEHLIQFYSTKSSFKNNQSDFFALDLDTLKTHKDNKGIIQDEFTKKYEISEAEIDGTLDIIGSTYSPENDRIYDGISRGGYKIVTFAPILKYKLFPLPEIIDLLLKLGNWGMGTPIEIEFAVNLTSKTKEFGLLQMRPLAINEETDDLKLENIKDKKPICKTDDFLGNGIYDDINDIILVNRNTFDRTKTREIANEISLLNNKLIEKNKNYLLIGFGRWGTLDPWLGIPVTWTQISGAKAIIESDTMDIIVEPSQGSHFFHNLTSFSVSYLTIKSLNRSCFIDWNWLESIKPSTSLNYVSHLKLKKSLTLYMNAMKKSCIIYS